MMRSAFRCCERSPSLPGGRSWTILTLAVAFKLLAAATIQGDEPRLEFNHDVRPILIDACISCHGPDSASRQADLRLDQREAAIEMAAITPGDPDSSEMIRRILSDDQSEVMPPPETKKHLTQQQKDLLVSWIAEGAEYQSHWSLISPARPVPPVPLEQAARVRNPIDAFVLAKLNSVGLAWAPEAARRTLARRAALDLTGLPPTPAQLKEFVADESSDAYDKYVDQLLASPKWGEHRARYWLDAARYGDTHGLHGDNYREIWAYRDWVIKAFNRNMPFDQFTIENLAGDLIENASLDQQIGSGFNRCNVTTSESGSIDEEYAVLYTRDRTETTSQVWLGLTAGCAACHDHKFDPLTQKEFYELSAFFHNTTQKPMDGNVKDTPPAIVVPRDEDQRRWTELGELISAAEKAIEERRSAARSTFDQWLAAAQADDAILHYFLFSTAAPRRTTFKAVEAAVIRSILAMPADKQTPEIAATLFEWWLVAFDESFSRLTDEHQMLSRERNDIQARGTIAHVMQERDEPAMAYVLNRGEYDQRLDPVTPSTPAFLPPFPADLPRNRLGFAQWLVRPGHPLTARVIVNRFWQEVFGQGLVRTAGDFGISGELPSHPELLDWLAVEFQESEWDVKRLFKLIVSSSVYRQSAAVTSDKLNRDLDNRLLSRGPRFRMDAEMVRDYALAASGLLSPKIGGPSVRPYQPPGVWEAVAIDSSNTRDYVLDSGESLYRRSLYTFWKRSAPPASMEIFNAPSREYCVVVRERTNTPLQALTTLNDPQFVEAARHLAENAIREAAPSFQSRLSYIALRLLARELTDEEQKIVRRNLDDLAAHYAAHADDARTLLDVGDTIAEPSIRPAELASWTMVANELMNLDEALNK